MGASICMKDNNTAKLKGINSLHGADIYASDLRAGASLIVAGLAASGTTNVHNSVH
jgi:UDP-N-acetylglucosamine 1-carboxyvinyltransferase